MSETRPHQTGLGRAFAMGFSATAGVIAALTILPIVGCALFLGIGSASSSSKQYKKYPATQSTPTKKRALPNRNEALRLGANKETIAAILGPPARVTAEVHEQEDTDEFWHYPTGSITFRSGLLRKVDLAGYRAQYDSKRSRVEYVRAQPPR